MRRYNLGNRLLCDLVRVLNWVLAKQEEEILTRLLQLLFKPLQTVRLFLPGRISILVGSLLETRSHTAGLRLGAPVGCQMVGQKCGQSLAGGKWSLSMERL